MAIENELIKKFYSWGERNEFARIDHTPITNNHPDVFWTFTPSSGAIFYIDLIKQEKINEVRRHSALTVQPCVRLQDKPSKLADSIDHCAFFRMAALHTIFGDSYDKKEAKLQQLGNLWSCLQELGIEPFKKKVLVVICDSGTWNDLQIEKDETSIEFWKSVGIPEKNIILEPPKVQETIFSSRAEPFMGPTIELYFLKDGKRIEFGIFIDFQYDRRFKDTKKFAMAKTLEELHSEQFLSNVEHVKNARNAFSFAVGIERLAMLLDNPDDIFSLPEISLIAESVRGQSKLDVARDEEKKMTIKNLCDMIRIAVFLTAEGLSPIGNKNHGRSKLFRNFILRPIFQCKNILSIDNENFFPEIINKTIDIYGATYPVLIKNRGNIAATLAKNINLTQTMKVYRNYLLETKRKTYGKK